MINHWKIECLHSPEMIDRIMVPIRKRGMGVLSLHYEQIYGGRAICHMKFEAEQIEAEKIYKNMLRILDIEHVLDVAQQAG